MKPNTYHITTFGCQMNERDSETLAGLLEQLGYAKNQTRQEAQIILLNTCSIRDNADKRFFGTLGQLKRLKQNQPDRLVAVCGCMMQQDRIVETLKKKYPWVDLVFGTQNIDEFPELLHQAATQAKILIQTYEDRSDIVEGLPASRRYPFKAYINIMFGCDNFCTYCIVPYTRGREKSRSPEAILDEARRLADDGTKEIMLLGQNVNSYKGSGGVSFAALIRQLEEVAGIERIRFMTSHPKDLSTELIEAFRRPKALCPHIHLPVQSGSTAVLARMNRRYSRDQYLELVDRLRQANPEISLTTDIIVGFPGETEEDFQDTLSLIEQVRFSSAFTFIYSPREGTPAAGMDEQISEAVKHERFDRLVDLVNHISITENQKQVGKTVSVLVEGPSKTDNSLWSGRTPEHRLVNFRSLERPQSLSPAADLSGQIVRVRVSAANTFSLNGEAVSP
ncbi:MAG TPA: tRNA (N6-isopentenyl adenosine(37)-C2)-methylthiotransferase MiaB [Clostridiales bacterium]|nr:tRNA (N6-isopentenyl adenosine(37)-C2)-methylthiotransferase MiaB [Clostridiales bacterium]